MTGSSDSYWAAVRNIDAALSPDERAAIITRFCAANPRWRDIAFDEILEYLIDTGAYAAQAGPFFDAHAHNGDLPATVGGALTYAAVAVCASGQVLTVQAVAGLLTRAGL